MKPDFTSRHAFLQLRPVDVTSESRQARAERVLSKNLAIIDLDAAFAGELERAFDKALANGREHAWEQFVERARSLAPNMRVADIEWLQRTLIAPPSSLRATSALARALGVVAEARVDWGETCAASFERLSKHPSPEVRSIVLEWLLEFGADVAHRIASQLTADPHPAVRQAAAAVLAAW
jgi:hypothetical protein